MNVCPRPDLCRRVAAQADNLAQQRVERNAEIKRLREGLEDIWEMYCDGHAGDCQCTVCTTVVRLLGITPEQRGAE